MSVKRLSQFLLNEELDPSVIDWTTELEDGGCNVVDSVSITSYIVQVMMMLH